MSEPSQWLTADVLVEDGDWSNTGDLDAIVSDVVAALGRHLPAKRANVVQLATVVFQNDAAVRALNNTYRRQDKATNVLSFPAPPLPRGVTLPLDEPQHLGDVVLAAETVTTEAADLGISVAAHLHHLVLHGLLHLLGHDHETAADAHAMEAIETDVLARLGIADPYAGTEPVDQI